jgi:hypothetical protein
LRRLRELRQDGYIIVQRRHPDQDRDVWQYSLVDKPEVSPIREVPVPGQEQIFDEIPDVEPVINKTKKLVFGQNVFCEYCGGKGMRKGVDCPLCGGRGWV